MDLAVPSSGVILLASRDFAQALGKAPEFLRQVLVNGSSSIGKRCLEPDSVGAAV